jgi:dTDP-4-dehydrorhamnose reductase
LKVAVTGAAGMLGHDIRNVFSDVELVALTRREVDITNLDNVLSAIREIKPDYVIHAAAYTDVDGSEHDPDKAYLVNGLGARNVAMACEEVKAAVVYISSDYVFDGTKGEPYNEWDMSNPVNQYGLSKLMGEKFVSSMTNSFYIVRTSWLYGKKGKNFVDTISRLLTERDEIRVVDDQVGSPTCTYDLAGKLRELIGKGYGTYHITNTLHCSWLEFAAEIAKLQSSSTRIIGVTSEEYGLPAKRPAFSVLNNTMLKLEGLSELRSWKESLKDYLSK